MSTDTIDTEGSEEAARVAGDLAELVVEVRLAHVWHNAPSRYGYSLAGKELDRQGRVGGCKRARRIEVKYQGLRIPSFSLAAGGRTF
jgi:hypothetical protein